MAKISKATQQRAARAERRQIKDAKAKAQPAGAGMTHDAYQNFAQSIGLGTDNSLTSSTYGFNPITRIRTLLEWIYRGSWFGSTFIDIIADDMTRAGIEIQSELPPEDIERLQQALVRHGVWGGFNETIKWGDLYGGALGLMMIDGQDPSTPLNIDRVGKEAFRGILVFDRWMVEPDLNDLVTDMGPEIGLPKFYRVVADAPAFRLKRIHHSRCIRFEGVRLPYWQRVMENLWGLSVFEPLYDRMVAFDSATMGMAQLVYKSYIRTYKLDGLRKLLTEGGDGERALIRWVEMTRRMQGNEGITLIDGKDSFEPSQQTTFTGVGDVVLQLAQQLAGSRQIPLTRLFGQSPAGLNATGESDLRTYYDGIKHKQELKMRSPMTKVLFVTAKSEGIKLGDKDTFQFRNLMQLSELERSEVFSRDAQSISGLESGSIIGLQTALKELRELSRVTGRMTNITDDAIKAASDEPAPSMGELGLDPNGLPVQPGDVDESNDPGMSLKKGPGAENAGKPNGAKPNGAAKPNGKVNGAATGARDLATVPDYGDLPVVVEAKRGDVRWPGANPLLCDYGYVVGVRSTESEGRNEEWMDCFLGPNPQSQDAWVIDMVQPGPGGGFEEHKLMLGFDAIDEAVQPFTQLYGPERAMGVTHMTIPVLRAWLDAGQFAAPLSAGTAKPTPPLRAER